MYTVINPVARSYRRRAEIMVAVVSPVPLKISANIRTTAFGGGLNLLSAEPRKLREQGARRLAILRLPTLRSVLLLSIPPVTLDWPNLPGSRRECFATTVPSDLCN